MITLDTALWAREPINTPTPELWHAVRKFRIMYDAKRFASGGALVFLVSTVCAKFYDQSGYVAVKRFGFEGSEYQEKPESMLHADELFAFEPSRANRRCAECYKRLGVRWCPNCSASMHASDKCTTCGTVGT